MTLLRHGIFWGDLLRRASAALPATAFVAQHRLRFLMVKDDAESFTDPTFCTVGGIDCLRPNLHAMTAIACSI
jgi:hypothetical protein